MGLLNKNIKTSLKGYYYYKEKGMYDEFQIESLEEYLKFNLPDEIVEYMINPEFDSGIMTSIFGLYHYRHYTLEQLKLITFPGCEPTRVHILTLDVEKGASMETIQHHRTCSLEEINALWEKDFIKKH